MKKLLFGLSTLVFIGTGVSNVTSCGIQIGKTSGRVAAKKLNTFFGDTKNFTDGIVNQDWSTYTAKSVLTNSKLNNLFAYVPSKKVDFKPTAADYMIFRNKIADEVNWEDGYSQTQKFNFIDNDQNLSFSILDSSGKAVANTVNSFAQGQYSVKLVVAAKSEFYKETYLAPGTYTSSSFGIYDLAPKTSTNKLQFTAPSDISKNISYPAKKIDTTDPTTIEANVKTTANKLLYTATQDTTTKGNIYNNIALAIGKETAPKAYPFDINDLNKENANDEKQKLNKETIYYSPNKITNVSDPDLTPVDWSSDTKGFYLFKFHTPHSSPERSKYFTGHTLWFEISTTPKKSTSN